MATYLKKATPQAEADLRAVRDTVAEILERIAPHAALLSDAELFPGHARSARVREEKYRR